MSFDPLLAHQGGWDEMIILLAPVAIFVVLRLLEQRRRRRSAGPGDASESSPTERPREG